MAGSVSPHLCPFAPVRVLSARISCMGRRGTDQQFLVNSWVQRKSAGSWAHLSQGLGFLALLYCVSQRTDPAGSLLRLHCHLAFSWVWPKGNRRVRVGVGRRKWGRIRSSTVSWGTTCSLFLPVLVVASG